MARIAPALLALLLTLGSAACGSADRSATATLGARLDRVDAAAVADDPEAISSAVASLLRAVDAAESSGELTATAADRIRTAAEALVEAADRDGAGSPTEPQESTAPPPPKPDKPEDEGGGGHGHGHEGSGKDKGKGKGHGNSDEDDEDDD